MKLDTANERRQLVRTRVAAPALLVFDGHAQPCGARDLSPEGAQVSISDPAVIPESLHFIDVVSGMAYPAKIVWRSADSVGLRFSCGLDLADALPTSPLRAHWLRNFSLALEGDHPDSMQQPAP
jgi:hypothetical protein